MSVCQLARLAKLNRKTSDEEVPTTVQKVLPLSPSNQAFDSLGVIEQFSGHLEVVCNII